MKIKLTILYILLSILSSYTISGFIKDGTNGEPLPYTNIVVVNTDKGAASDVNGYFIVPDVDQGNYIIKAMMIGYDSGEQEVDINKNIKIAFELFPTPIEGSEIKVSAERMRFEKKVDISRVNLTNRDIRRAPAFIESDVFRTLQLLPSVSSSNDFNAALIVRGGSPDENLILLDGAEIYNPYHIGGVFSTFNSGMIADTEFLAGGFPSNYGGRLSSVLTITARDGDSKNGRLKNKFPNFAKYWDFSKANTEITLLSSKILAEGALLNGSWMFSARRTYFDKFVDMYYQYQDDTSPANYYFWDTHFKAKTSITPNNQLIYSQFSGKDDLFVSLGGEDFPGIEFNWDWGNSTKNITWRFMPNSSYIVNTSIARTKYSFNVDFAIEFITEVDDDDSEDDTSSDINRNSTDLTLILDNLVEDFDVNQNIKYIYNEDLTLESGWQLKYLNLDYIEVFGSGDSTVIDTVTDLKSNPQTYSSFVNMTWKPFPLFYINTGIRVSKYNAYDKFLFDPKIALKYNPTGNLALKFTVGKYSQFLYTINQEEELLRIVDFWQPIPNGEKPQESIHYIIGSEYWISDGNTLSIETYYKDYSHIYDLNPLIDVEDVEGTLAVSGIAKGFGFEILYRLRLNKLSGWISYAYSGIERTVDLNSDGYIWDEKEKYPAKYNKPHSFNSVLSYQINSKYSFGISSVYGSGQTYTPVIGKVHQTAVQRPGAFENPYQFFGNIYGARNSSKYPNYFRLDINFSRKTKLFGLEGDLKFQIINLTNHYNVLLYNWNHNASPSTVQAFSMFPFICTIGWEFNL